MLHLSSLQDNGKCLLQISWTQKFPDLGILGYSLIQLCAEILYLGGLSIDLPILFSLDLVTTPSSSDSVSTNAAVTVLTDAFAAACADKSQGLKPAHCGIV